MDEDLIEEIETLAERDGRFHKDAYLFIYKALRYTVKMLGKISLPREQCHISGRELLGGISEYGLDQFGPLARSVFARWGVHETRDFGTMVFNLVDAQLMSKTKDDCIEDFVDIYDFSEEFNWKKRKMDFWKKSQLDLERQT